MNRIILVLLVIFFASCSNSSGKKTSRAANKKHVTLEPVNKKIFPVPAELVEISGISFVNDSVLVAIQDEEGILYFYNLNEEDVSRKYEFWKGKDYEDLAVAGNDLYVINSSGTIYKISNFKEGPSKPTIYKTPLKAENDIEGLAYDKAHNRLLLAVKDQSLSGSKEEKDIYAFDLGTNQLSTEPVYSIRLKEIEHFFKGDEIEEVSKKLLKAIGNKNLNEVFRTTALNFHPLTGEIYVLSSMNNIIAVLDPGNGSIKRILELDGPEFMQPEGLAFNSKGQLFISNEGKKMPANIVEVEYEK